VTRARRRRVGRRGRLLLLVCSLFAAAVLATSFALSELLGQRAQLAQAQGQLTHLSSQDRVLSAEARRLTDPSTEAAIARADYGFVTPGQSVYDILPSPGSPITSGASSGHVPLQGSPVVPGSATSQALLDTGAMGASSVATSTAAHGAVHSAAPAPTTSGASHGSVASGTGASSGRSVASGTGTEPSSIWGRIVQTLEFWR
jgi:cell division protein FtsB